nr:hypothetical protein [Isoalcanivorax pacificus]
MQPLGDADMAAVTGQEGVALALELRVNMTEDGRPLGVDGAPSEYGVSCSGVNNPCRWALSFANRDNVWLVFNGWSVAVKVNDILLDVIPEMTPANVPGFDLSMADGRPATHNRFFDINDECMLSNCTSVNDVPAAIQAMPAMRLTTPSLALSYDPGTNVSSGFTNTEIALNLDGLAAITAVDGYAAPVPGTFLGAQIGDVEVGNNFMGWAFQGEVYVFGY